MNQDNHQNVTTTAADELRDDQLDKVTGGLVVTAIIAILIAPVLPLVQSARKP